MNHKGNDKYALLKDGTIVKITYYSDTEDPLWDSEWEQDIYFEYRFIDRIRLRRKTAFARISDVVAFGNNVKSLKKLFKRYQRLSLKHS